MPIDVEALLNQIDANLGAAVSSSTQNSRAVDNPYEAFLYGLVLRAARTMDAKAVAWQNLTGPNGDEVRLRGGPGEVFSPNFSFATLTFGGNLVFELHQGVRIRGISGVAHECDIVALHAGRGAWRRARTEQPQPIDTFLAIEAKAYDATRIGLGIGRAVLGLRTDLQLRRVLFVAARPIDQSAEQLLDGWTAGAFPDVAW